MNMRHQLRGALVATVVVVTTAGIGRAIGGDWTGAGTDNNWTTGAYWLTGTAPVNDGTADVTISSMRRYQTLFGNTSQSILSLATYSIYHEFDGSGATLTIGAGGLVTGGEKATFKSTLPISLTSGSQTWTIGGKTQIDGTISGNNVNLSINVGGYHLTLAGANSLTGTSTVKLVGGMGSGALRLGNDNALGGATLIFETNSYSAVLSSYNGDRTLANTVTLSATYAGDPLSFDTNEGKLTFTGPVTLSGSPSVNVVGPLPVVFSGTLSTGMTSLTLAQGDILMAGTLTTSLTSGPCLVVNGGRFVFGSGAVLPTTSGSIQLSGGYVGAGMTTSISNYFNLFTSTSTGTIGFDPPSGSPTISENISLADFTSPGPRLGSSTQAKLTGTITPNGTIYRFGGGGGLLEVASSLTDGANGRVVLLESPSEYPLTLLLSGANTYAGGTSISWSVLRFASGALPASGNFIIPASSLGYLGFDYAQSLSALGTRVTFGGNYSTLFLGYDGGQTITTSIDLSAYPDDNGSSPYRTTVLGTSTALTLSGAITPAGGTSTPWRFAAVKDGQLTINSPSLASTSSRGVVIGYVPSGGFGNVGPVAFNDYRGTVTLLGNNIYSGGTILQGGRLVLGNSNALGSGALSVTGEAVLATTTTSVTTVTNPINIPSFTNLHLDGTNSFTLSGNITGHGSLIKEGAGTVELRSATLQGIEIDPVNEHRILQGTLSFTNNFSTDGLLSMSDGTALNIASEYMATIAGLESDTDGTSSTATVNIGAYGVLVLGEISGMTYSTYEPYFKGIITGGGKVIMNGSGAQLLGALPGPSTNSYAGGTRIQQGSIFAMSNGALGTGPVSIECSTPTGGGLGLYTGVTLTNSLTLTEGMLGGFGTFAPSGGVVVGANCVLAPAEMFDEHIGTLGFGTGLTLASGGTYEWSIADVTGTPGVMWDKLSVTGTLTITATQPSPFILAITQASETTGFDNTLSYSWVIASATTTAGYDPLLINTLFTIDTSNFYSSLGIGHFFVNQSGNDVLLNFTPVPEPSTYVLMGLGVLLLARTLRRRRD
jgi:hypothetical protein